MRLSVTLYAHDVMDQVWISIQLHMADDDPEVPPRAIMAWHTTIPGVGETDPAHWAANALVGALEAL